MGFMDKAKQMADQAQKKIDDVQKQFNENGSGQSTGPATGQRFDSAGRPIPAEGAGEGPPAAQTPAAPVDPVAPSDPAQDLKPGMNSSPDPLKPIE